MNDNIQVSKPTVPMQNRGGYFYPLTSGDQVIINNNQKLGNLFDLIYPIGSIYMSMNNTDPSVLFGGKWTSISGRFLIGVGELDDNTTDYWGALTEKCNMPAGEKGGQVKHKLTIDEMPSHIHDVGILVNGWDNWGDDSLSDYEYSFTSWSNPKGYGGSVEHTCHVLAGVTATVGGDGSHNNIPPYYAVYMWQRIG